MAKVDIVLEDLSCYKKATLCCSNISTRMLLKMVFMILKAKLKLII